MEGGDICVEISAVFCTTAGLRGTEVSVEAIDRERKDAAQSAWRDLEREGEGGGLESDFDIFSHLFSETDEVGGRQDEGCASNKQHLCLYVERRETSGG